MELFNHEPDEPVRPEEQGCVICCERRASVRAYPCGHQVFCRKCGVTMIQVRFQSSTLCGFYVIHKTVLTCQAYIMDRLNSSYFSTSSKRARTACTASCAAPKSLCFGIALDAGDIRRLPKRQMVPVLRRLPTLQCLMCLICRALHLVMSPKKNRRRNQRLHVCVPFRCSLSVVTDPITHPLYACTYVC